MNLKYSKGYSAVIRPATEKQSAVVLLLVRGADADIQFLLLKRRPDLRGYPGDWCLPGGRHESGDDDLLQTGYRELEEETGINRQMCRLLCQLDDFYNSKGELVRPYIVELDSADFVTPPQASEVIETRLVDCSELEALQQGSPPGTLSTRDPAYYMVLTEHDKVWGLTASILVHAHNVLNNTSRTVDFGDQYYEKGRGDKA